MANKAFLLPPLCVDDLLELQRLMRAEKISAAVIRRCRLIWQLAAGYNLKQSAEMARLHYANAHLWIKRFKNDGISRLLGKQRNGRPRLYKKRLETKIIKLATSRPTDLGLGFTTWSLSKLEVHLRCQKGLEALSRETIRRILHKHGLRFLNSLTWYQSIDPEFEKKKRHNTAPSKSAMQ